MSAFTGKEQHSDHHDVWDSLKRQTDVAIIAAEFADSRKGLTEASSQLRREFENYEKVRARMDAAGMVGQMKLDRVSEVAYREWIRGESEEPLPRVFTSIPDPPIGPEHE